MLQIISISVIRFFLIKSDKSYYTKRTLNQGAFCTCVKGKHTCCAYMESYNAILIEQNVSQAERLKQLNNMAKSQLRVLQQSNFMLFAEGRKSDDE